MKGDEIVVPCDRYSNETLTLRKLVSKYENMQSLLSNLRKFGNHGIKIALVNQILITKSINSELFTLILYMLGVRCDVDIFKLTAVLSPLIEKSITLIYLKLARISIVSLNCSSKSDIYFFILNEVFNAYYSRNLIEL